jgi:Lecithin retinol acyltransferase
VGLLAGKRHRVNSKAQCRIQKVLRSRFVMYQIGDQIYVPIKGGPICHHGIYVGNGEVVHMDRTDSIKNKLSSVSGIGKYKIEKVSLEKFAGSQENIHRIKASRRKTGLLSHFSEEGCSRPPEEVVKRALKVSESGETGTYDLFGGWKNLFYLKGKEINCEHFATWCRTGRSFSKQADNAMLAAFGIAALSGVIFIGIVANEIEKSFKQDSNDKDYSDKIKRQN